MAHNWYAPISGRPVPVLKSCPVSSRPPIPPAIIRQRIGELRAEVATAEEYLATIRAELAWYEHGEKLFGDAPPNPDVVRSFPGLDSEPPRANGTQPIGTKPTLRVAILTVMRERPGKTWPVESVIAELRQRDWLPTGTHAEHRTRSTLAQMHRKGQAKRMDRGRYRLPPEPKDGT